VLLQSNNLKLSTLNHTIRNLPRNSINARAQMPTNLRRKHARIHNPHVLRPIHPPLPINNTTQLLTPHSRRAHRVRVRPERAGNPLLPRRISQPGAGRNSFRAWRDFSGDVFGERLRGEVFAELQGGGRLDEGVDGQLEEVRVDAGRVGWRRGGYVDGAAGEGEERPEGDADCGADGEPDGFCKRDRAVG
jgi:hypothetical protein